ncbi:MAG: hypothetical protein AAF560_01455 [Acidobacteriota bacterium]
MLVADGKLTQQQLAEALRNQQQHRGRLGTSLLELGMIEEDALLATLGRQRATKTVSKDELASAPSAVIRMIPPKLALRYAMVPFQLKGRTLLVASGNIGDALKEDEIGHLTSCMVRTCIGLELRIFAALNQHYGVKIPKRYQELIENGAAARQRRSVTPRAPQPTQMTPIPPSLRASAAPTARTPEPRPAIRRPVQQAPATTPPPARRSPPPTLFIELDEEDAALLGRSPGTESAAQPDPDEPVLLKPAPLPWLARESAAQEDDGTAGEANAGAAADSRPPAEEPDVAGGLEPVAPTAPLSAADQLAATAPLGMSALASIREAEDLEARLQAAAEELKHAEIRDEIADVLLAFCEPFFERRLLLFSRGDAIVGWRGEGTAVERDQIRSISVERDKPSVFLGLRSADSFWLGALPELPANRELAEGLGGDFPKDCLVLPVTLRSRVVCYIYGDNLAAGVSGSPLAELKRLAAMAALAFEVYILKHKMRLV